MSLKTFENIAYNDAPDRIKTLFEEFNDEKGILVPVGDYTTKEGVQRIKSPLAKWKNADQSSLNLNIDWNNKFNPNSAMNRIAIGFNDNIDEKVVVLDLDDADAGALALVETLLKEYNNKIIAYPTRKGAHLWFKIPNEFQDGKWWKGRKVGYVTKTGIGSVDYLNGGLINIALKSAKTNQMELLLDTNNFLDTDINKDMKELFERVGFNSLEFNWNTFENLPSLPVIAYPLRTPKNDETIADIKFSTGAGRNTEAFTQWAGMLNMKSELGDDELTDMEECLYWMNENLTGDAWFEDLDQVIESVQQYNNEHCFEPYRRSGKNRKDRVKRNLEHIEKEADLSKKEVDWEHYWTNIKTSSTVDNAEFLIEALDVRLISGTTLVLRKGQKDIFDSRTVASVILATRKGFWTEVYDKEKKEMVDKWISFGVSTKWAKQVMEDMVGRLNYLINVECKTEYIADYVTKPLWVDINGLCIDPFELLDENGKLRIMTRVEAGIDRDVVPFNLLINFKNLWNYDRDSYELLNKWIYNAVGNDKSKFDYFFKYYGYTFMIGSKFTRQIGLVEGISGSGKSSLEEIISKSVIGSGKTGKAKNNLFDGKFGLQSIAAKSRGVLDEGASAFKNNSENIKNVTGEQTTLVEPKGAPVFEAFIPKITALFNQLPETLDYSDPAVLNRIAYIYLENPLTEDFTNNTFNTLLEKGGPAFFLHVLNVFKDADKKDITTSEKSDFWKSPFQERLDSHIEQGDITNYFSIERLIERHILIVENKTSTEIKKQILNLDNEFDAKKFINENRNNLNKALKSLGYKNNTANKSWRKVQ